MKIMIYNERPDETAMFDQEAGLRGWTISRTPGSATAESAALAEGAEAAFITLTTRLTAPVIGALRKAGVKYILTRSTGVDHIDQAGLAKYGMKAANVPVYSEHAVPEFSILLMLALIRKFPVAESRIRCRDFSMDEGIQGRELSSMTVGVIGTGLLGGQTIRLLHGFGCRILAASPHPKKDLMPFATFVDEATLFRESDIIDLHCALTKDTEGMINKETLALMKNGVYIVNTARGGLLSLPDVLAALKSGKIAGLAADVTATESTYLRRNWKGAPVPDPDVEALLAMGNVIYTPHMAYFTDTSIRNIIAHSFENLDAFLAEDSTRMMNG